MKSRIHLPGQYIYHTPQFCPFPPALPRARDFIGLVANTKTYAQINAARETLKRAQEREENPFRWAELHVEIEAFRHIGCPY